MYFSALEISEAKHADLIGRMTAQLRELNTVKQDAHREMSDLKKKLQVCRLLCYKKVFHIQTFCEYDFIIY